MHARHSIDGRNALGEAKVNVWQLHRLGNHKITFILETCVAFLIETMSEQDHAKIFAPDNKKLICKYCAPYHEWRPHSLWRWAIDRGRGIILCHIQKWEPRDGKERYLLMFEDSPMVIEMSTLDWKVDPIDAPPIVANRIDEIRAILREAFSLYGLYGLRPPKPYETPVPVFL